MKVTVVKEFTFDSAHYLPNHPGKCSSLHGHTYKLQIGFKGQPDEVAGMVIDFGEIKSMVEALLSSIDHKNLNEVNLLNFPSHAPTAENMVTWFVQHFEILVLREIKYVDVDIELVLVRLWETPTCYAEWQQRDDERAPINC